MQALRKKIPEPILETGEPEPDQVDQVTQVSVAASSAWMLGISLALFFFPVVNGMLGGAIGGYRMGSAKGAIIAAIAPLLGLAAGMWMLYTLVRMPAALHNPAAGGITALIALSCLALLLGAAIGGTVAQNRSDRKNRA